MLKESDVTEIYQKNSKELYIYIYRFIRSTETAEDLLHDCFVNLIKYSASHDIKPDGIRAFLYKTAHNLSINFLKRKKNIEFASIETTAEMTHDENHDERISAQILNNKIYNILSETDQLSKSIFIMKKELNMTIPEIAKHTGKSERTVSRRLSNIIALLADELKDERFV